MSDLFNDIKKQPATPDYSAQDIEVLEGLEPVRRRPGMYIGGTDKRALHHLVVEVFDNAMDEAVAGYANRIEVSLEKNGHLTIIDNGRGIPIDSHPKFPHLSALEVILTTLHSGGKFSNKAYETSGGLHGVGLSVVNALSNELHIEIVRDKTLWTQDYSRGHPLNPLTQQPGTYSRRGTLIRFHPDPLIFGEEASLDPAVVYQLVRSKAFLFRGVEIRWSCDMDSIPESVPAKDRIHFPEGIKDFLTQQCYEKSLVVPEFFVGKANFSDKQGHIEWALAWLTDEHENSLFNSYCNTIATPLGGTHETGFRQAILRSLKSYGDHKGNKKAASLMAEDCFSATMGVISLFIRHPHFQGQTKEKLVNPEVTKWIESVVKDHFDHWLSGNPQQAQSLLETLIERAEERLRRRQSKELSRQTATRRLRLPGKLADCSQTAADGTEIFLVEGDSAGGSAKQARDRMTQAILPLRGKILNVATATVDKLLNNQELKNLVLALGCGTGKQFDLEKLRYEKVIIMTDADVDGAHIASLLITFFFRELPHIVKNGHLYIAQPPLYKISQGTKSFYAQDDKEKEKILGKFISKEKIEISRFKGLGEMPAAQLKETTMNRQSRSLIRVILPAPEENLEESVEQFVENLMGRRADLRFSFIQNNAKQIEVDL